MAQAVKKESSTNAGDQVQSLGQEDPLKKGMATHSSILAWRIPWTEEPIRLQFMGSQRVGHDWATHTFTFWIVKDKQWGQTSGSCPGSMACLPKPQLSHYEMTLIILHTSWGYWENMGKFRVFSKQVVIAFIRSCGDPREGGEGAVTLQGKEAGKVSPFYWLWTESWKNKEESGRRRFVLGCGRKLQQLCCSWRSETRSILVS